MSLVILKERKLFFPQKAEQGRHFEDLENDVKDHKGNEKGNGSFMESKAVGDHYQQVHK